MNYSNSQRAGVILYLAASLFGGYFEIGGNSIQAIQITNQMTEKIGCFMDIGKLFEYPTISKIERYILEET